MLNNFCEEPSDMKVISWCLQTKMHRLWDHPPARQGPTQAAFSIYTQHNKYMPLKIISRQTSTSEILGDNHIDHPSKACQASTQAFINFNF